MMTVTREELRTVPAFGDLPDEQLDWFLANATAEQLAPGKVYVRAGEPADHMVVVVEGELSARFADGSDTVFDSPAGSVVGVLPFSRMKVFPSSHRGS